MKHLLIILFCLFLTTLFGQTSLSPGDIAFVGYNTDNPDGFSFVSFVTIAPGSQIFFTDQGWSGTDWYSNSEDHLVWTAPEHGIECGSVITIIEDTVVSDSFYVSAGVIDFSSGSGWSLISGDQVIAYQGTKTTPAFIAAINGDNESDDYDQITTWNTGQQENSSSSAIPSGLTNGLNALSLFPNPDWMDDERDNAKYEGPVEGNIYTIKSEVMNLSNWSSTNSPGYDLLPGSYDFNISCVSLSVEPLNKEEKLEIYPNPFIGEFNVIYEVKKKSRVKVVLYDASGRVIKELINGEQLKGKKSLQVYGIEKGIYFIHLIIDNNFYSKRVINF